MNSLKLFRLALMVCFLLCISNINFAQDAKPKEESKPKEQETGILDFVLKDGTNVKGKIVQKEISVKTKYGVLQVPTNEIISVEVAEFREKDWQEIEKRITDLIKQLGDDSWTIRELATKQLVGLGNLSLPYVNGALKNPDPEIKMRAQMILDQINKAKDIKVAKGDEIVAKEFTIKGWIQTEVLKVKTEAKEIEIPLTKISRIAPPWDPGLQKLPAGSISPESRLGDETKLLKSAEPQIIRTKVGVKFSFKITYQVFAPTNPGELDQTFFIASWTPQWPPPEGYYFPVYDGGPGLPPGVNSDATVSFQSPQKPGTYYLWWCSSAHYSMGQGVGTYTKPLDGPAHIKIIVEKE